jgi:GT2 family glycosyltransferase
MRNAHPSITVVMLTHNRCDEVQRTLSHTCTLPEQPTIIVVDNASTDGTPDAILKHFPQVHLIRADTNLGAAARTLGVNHATSPYVALSDDDTHWQPGSLQRAIELFDNHRRLAVITARVLVGEEEREDPTCAQMARSPLPTEPGMPGRPLLGFLAGASAVRRSAFLECGGFEPRFFLGGEEELLAADLATSGWCLCYIPELVVRHYPSLQRDAASRLLHLQRNALWFAWLRRPLDSALARTLRMACTGGINRTKLRAFAAALAGLPWVLRERRVVPPAVEQGLRRLESAYQEGAHAAQS